MKQILEYINDQLEMVSGLKEKIEELEAKTEELLALVEGLEVPSPEEPEDPTPPQVSLPANTPERYEVGSGVDIPISVSGTTDGDILVMAWSDSESQMVDEFVHTLEEEPWVITSDKLDLLPSGRNNLQLLVRFDGVENRSHYHWISVVREEEEGEPTPPGRGFHVEDLSRRTAVYVSPNGNGNGRTPDSPTNLSNGINQVQSGGALLLQAGAVFNSSINSWSKSNVYIGAYGDSTQRPVIRPSSGGNVFSINGGQLVSNLTIQGIEFDGVNVGNNCLRAVGAIRNWHIEDCVFKNARDNVLFQQFGNNTTYENIKFYRNIVMNSRSCNNAHSQGLYALRARNVEVVECVFDHNGWGDPTGTCGRTMFNHNLYIDVSCRNFTVKDCVITNGSSHGLQLRCGGVVDNNFFAYNPCGIFAGGWSSEAEYATISNNVVALGNDMVPAKSGTSYDLIRGWGIEVKNGGTYINNLVMDRHSNNPRAGFFMGTSNNSTALPAAVVRNNYVKNWFGQNSEPFAIGRNVSKQPQVTNMVKVSGGPGVNDYHRGFNDFLQGARNRGRGVWNEVYTAKAINDFLRRGNI